MEMNKGNNLVPEFMIESNNYNLKLTLFGNRLDLGSYFDISCVNNEFPLVLFGENKNYFMLVKANNMPKYLKDGILNVEENINKSYAIMYNKYKDEIYYRPIHIQFSYEIAKEIMNLQQDDLLLQR